LRELARLSGYSFSYLSRVETGKRAATRDVVRLYATLPIAEPFRNDSSAERGATASIPPPRHPVDTNRGLDLGIIWFGAELRRRRMAQGKSLKKLGAEAYLSAPYLGKIEQGNARGNYQQALMLDTALDAGGKLAALFLEECARVGPVAPDVGILTHDQRNVVSADPAELAAMADDQLRTLRVRSHEDGPYAVLGDLGTIVAELHGQAIKRTSGDARLLWTVALRYAEFLGWMAQETGQDGIALRWTRAAADWARNIGDNEALGYALIRQSQWARRKGDAGAALDYAVQAGAVPHISPRIAQFAAQREAQAYALARDEAAFRAALDRFYRLMGHTHAGRSEDLTGHQWGPLPDPSIEESGLFEATCLVDLGDFATAATLFARCMGGLGSARTGYARIAIREAIAYAHVGEPQLACEVALNALPTVARQGSASLRGDLSHLTRTLNRHRHQRGVRDLLPDLAMLARAAGAIPANDTARRRAQVPSSASQE
jgi:transcriptional regulator with XRE-family HTH domain